MSRSGVMLCYPYDDGRLARWGNKCFIQPKLDGDRCRAIFDEQGSVTLLSSECRVITSVPHVNKSLMKTFNLKNFELDGELYRHGMSHPDIHGIVARTVNLHDEYEKVQYHIFDVVTHEPQHERVEMLHAFEAAQVVNKDPNLHIVETSFVREYNEIEAVYTSFISEGYEGIILRRWEGHYERKRSTDVMKFKPRRSDHYLIVGVVEECDLQGTPKGRVGAFICTSGTDHTTFRVGTGPVLTAAGRDRWWNESPIGKILEVKFQELSKDQIPRFPVAFSIKNVKEVLSNDLG